MVRMGHSSSVAALRYQHVTAGREAAIAAAWDELVQAASAHSEGTVRAGHPLPGRAGVGHAVAYARLTMADTGSGDAGTAKEPRGSV